MFRLFLILSILFFTSPSFSKDFIKGPIKAKLIRVIDGDTILVKARVWLGQDVEVFVRLRGIDAPEIKGKCKYEVDMANKSRKYLKSIIDKKIFLFDVTKGKYSGRVIAKVVSNGYNINNKLLLENMAYPYKGRGKVSWCK